MKINEISLIKFCFMEIKLRTEILFTFVMHEYDPVIRVYRHFPVFGIGILWIFSTNWALFSEFFVTNWECLLYFEGST